ncbi:uncharacterized protein A4U43_C05F17110 [Asparagus officinalis]|uniref:TORTIFOLIA1/SINE1-2 N-terminal domain-containing protein n=1 Tax=Asparagus officinalis TaxID=4686 RepID=A0A5P1EXL5_ASPOF|nr:uncharacterized protein LOC109843926 [Asparagus officinalis]XP_020268497.1 uncharacterized protein LOC109843926 [Asparagus officinalis]ONK68890.1 uncharacterized protein A4U43_C05F17110 [Asparagus officinalis]
MGRSLSPIVQRELENLDKDAESRRSAMKTLKSYAKDLDSKAIPLFLAQVSETKGPNSSSGECTISLYEVLARVHGRNIVPQIDNIMTTIVRTLSSSAGSFPIHQACSKVVPAMARYGIDPSTPDIEKARIIASLCKPLSDVLMGSQESLASGSALCLKALIESNNWKFASDDIINEVCLKVAGALEEKATQTNSHMGVVMALAKHNVFTVEAYARSLIRSGLQILDAGVSENNSQKRFSAIQMINFLMKCVDSRSILSELAKVIDIMEKCQADHMPYVRGAAFEALQTAKFITSQRGPKHEISSSPISCSHFYIRNSKSPRGRRDNNVTEFASPESQTVDSCITYDAFTDSPLSTAQSSCNLECSKRANRRLWNNDLGGVDVSLKDGLFLKACSACEDSDFNGELNTDKVYLESFSGFVHARPTSRSSRENTPSPQRSRTQLTIDDIKIFETPRKLVRSLQNSTGCNSPCSQKQDIEIKMKPTSYEVKRNPNNVEDERNKDKKITPVEDGEANDSTESVSSSNDLPQGSATEVLEGCEVKAQVQKEIKKKTRHGKAAVCFFLGLLFIFLGMLLSAMRLDSDEVFYDVVPT